MSTLSLYTTTFNCGRTPLSTDFFAANLFDALATNLPPDLVVLSLQEIAPLGYSFLGGSLLAPYFSRFGDAVRIAAQEKFGAEVEYETVVVRNVGLTGLMLFARPEVAQKIVWMKTAGVGVGVWEMGNKGAVGARIALEGEGDQDVVLTFVAAHFAPMEDACERRNQDWRDICESLVFENDSRAFSPGQAGDESTRLLSSESDSDDSKQPQEQDQQTLFSPLTRLFFLGDLNYRTSDTAPTDSSHENWPQPGSSLEDPHHYAHLLSHDQLSRERKANRTLHHLSEPEIKFPPTYKYASAAQKHAEHVASLRKSGSTAEGENDVDDDHEVWLWAKHRTPSWCDRILYLPASKPKINSYTALPIQPTSDHRPVALSCSIASSPMKSEVKPPFNLKPDWRERRAAARRYELVVGLAAYLGWTWEGEALLLGTVVGVVGGWLMFRALVGGV